MITGFTCSFAQRIPNGERREYLKPMLFSGGVGQLDDRHLHKGQPEKDMLVVKVGGPAYRIALPHRYTTSLYHLALPPRSTTSLYHLALPHRYTTSLYRIALPPRSTTSLYHIGLSGACPTR